jgi:hypothetical protein
MITCDEFIEFSIVQHDNLISRAAKRIKIEVYIVRTCIIKSYQIRVGFFALAVNHLLELGTERRKVGNEKGGWRNSCDNL